MSSNVGDFFRVFSLQVVPSRLRVRTRCRLFGLVCPTPATIVRRAVWWRRAARRAPPVPTGLDCHPARALRTAHAQVVVKGGAIGRLLEPVMRFQFGRMGARAPAFKRLVETGQAPDLRHARGPIPATC